jgi:glycosyltransferase involved in cell wall biosynthesis
VSTQRHTPERLFSVVIASRCDDARSELLKRACDSVRAMAGNLDYSIIVVANGARVSSSVLDWLAKRSDVHVIRLRSGSYPLARRVGAELANSEFVAFLDDDDELLPNTLTRRVEYFSQHPEVDVLVTDGLRVNGSKESRIFPPPEARSSDLVETMMHAGWGAGALVLRAKNVDLAAFDAEFRHLEWTLTALQLARQYQVGYLDEPTYRYYEDTPNSLWKMAEHRIAALDVWRRLLKSYAGTPYEGTVRRRLGSACHVASWEFVRQGKVRDAWRLHIEALTSPGGFAVLPSTARLLLASLVGLVKPGKSGKHGGSGAKYLDNSLDAQKGSSEGSAN